MKKVLALAALLFSDPAFAGSHGVGATGASGSAQLGLGATDLVGAFMNEMKMGSFVLGTNSPAILDVNQYPISTPTSDVGGNVNLPSSYTTSGIQWVLKWPAGITAKVLMNDTLNYVSDNGNCTVNHAVNATLTMTGTNCRVVFTIGNNPVSLHPHFPASGTYAHTSGDLVLARVSDEAAIDAGGIFTPEFINTNFSIGDLNPKTIRPMGWNFLGLNGGNIALWKYRPNLGDVNWNQVRYVPSAQAGNAGSGTGIITGTDNYVAAPAADTNLTSPVNGETIQGTFLNASTPNPVISSADGTGCSGNVRLTVNSSAVLSASQAVYIQLVAGTVEANGFQTIASVPDGTHVCLSVPFVNAYSASSSATIGFQTLTVQGRAGSTFMASALGGPFGIQFSGAYGGNGPTANGYGTLVYDASLNLYLFDNSPLAAAIPIEVQVALANAANANLWINIPNWFTDASVTSLGTLVKGSLNPSLNAYFEYSNEMWNTQFLNTFFWAVVKATSVGIPGVRNFDAWYGLRTRQMMDNLTTVWGSQTNFKRVLATETYTENSTAITPDRLNGTHLSTANGALWTANVPSTSPCFSNYNVAPCRPVDGIDVMAQAFYADGGNLYPFGGYAARNAVFMQTLANLYSDGIPADTVIAEQMIDNDIRQGTISVQAITSFSGATITLNNHGYGNGYILLPTTTGTLPTGLTNTPPTGYCVVNATTNTFQLSTTACNSGSPISLSGGSGALSFGVLSGGGFNCVCLLVLSNAQPNSATGNGANGYYPMFEAMMASYDSVRAGFTPPMAPITGESYEGGFEFVMPTAAQCTTMGVTAPPIGGGTPTAAGCSAQLVALGEAYKNSAFASALQLAYFNQIVGKDASNANFGLLPHMKTPSNLAKAGVSQWSLQPGNLTSMPYQYYYGFKVFRYP